MGFIQVANEAMCRPIRALTQVRQFMCLTAINWKIFYMLHIVLQTIELKDKFLAKYFKSWVFSCRQKDMTPPNMCWHALVVLEDSTPVLLHDP